MSTVKNSVVTGQWLVVSLLISGSSSFPRGWHLVNLSRNILNRLHGIFASFVIYRFYKLLFRSSLFTCFLVMILPRVAIRGLVSTLSSAFMNILFASTSLDFPTALYVCEVNSSFRKMLEVAD